MSLTPDEREEFTNLYAQMKAGGKEWNPTPEAKEEANKRLDEALWAAMCHTTGRCGLAVDHAYPDSPQARIYQLLQKALR